MVTKLSGAALFWAAIAAILALFLGLTLALAFAVERAPGAAASSDVTELQVTLTEFEINPGTLNAPVGAPVRVVVRNEGGIDHDFVVEGAAGTDLVRTGGETVLDLGVLEPGAYRFLCTVAGHDVAGMEGVLHVGDEDDHAGHGGDLSAEEMARLHEQGVADFPVETEGMGGLPLEPVIDSDGTKAFELTAAPIEWEVEPGVVRQGIAYNGMIPGPRIDVDLGDQVRIVLHNELVDPTALHLHGLLLPNDMDGVPGLTQPSIMPGESFTYEFTVRNSGSHMYHSHFDAARQVPGGLLGAFVVNDPADPEVDLDYVMILNDGPLGYSLNGKGFPATEPIVTNLGETVRVRYMNEGLQIHPMHLHGIPQTVIARDGYPLPQPYMADTINVAPGERIDVLIEASELGAWAWHCHILNHVEAADGMFGMVTALIVQ